MCSDVARSPLQQAEAMRVLAKAEPEKSEGKSEELAEMLQQLAAMQTKLEKLSNENK